MKNLKNYLLAALLFLCYTTLFAQPPRGGREQGGGPEEMIAREKQTLYGKMTDLTDDQKMLLNGIYEEFTVTLKETFQEMKQNNLEREARREKMESLFQEKNELIADVLSEEQYKVYESIVTTRRKRRNQDNSNKDGQ